MLSELPETRATLPLRLLGRGATQRRAMADLAALPEDAWERWPLVRILGFLRLVLDQPGIRQSAVEKELVMNMQLAFAKWEEEWIFEGIREGLQQGLQQGLQEGHQQGLQEGIETMQQSLAMTCAARFEQIPQAVVSGIRARTALGDLRNLLPLFVTGSAEEIAARLLPEAN